MTGKVDSNARNSGGQAGGALAIALVVGAQITLHAAAQSDWTRIVPVERGRQVMSVDSAPAPSGAIRLIFEYDGIACASCNRRRWTSCHPHCRWPQTRASVSSSKCATSPTARSRASPRRRLSRPASNFSRTARSADHAQDAPRATGAFTVVVPTTAAADHVTIVRIAASSNDPRSAELRATDLVSFPLTR